MAILLGTEPRSNKYELYLSYQKVFFMAEILECKMHNQNKVSGHEIAPQPKIGGKHL
jgi:hypothetical protein